MNSTPKNHAGDDFTAEMRDKQARGKDPYGDPEEERNIGGETFTSQEQRRLALQMLDDPEGLMTEAQRTGDSVPGVRRNYERILSGIPQESGQSTSTNSSKSKRGHKRPATGSCRARPAPCAPTESPDVGAA